MTANYALRVPESLYAYACRQARGDLNALDAWLAASPESQLMAGDELP